MRNHLPERIATLVPEEASLVIDEPKVRLRPSIRVWMEKERDEKTGRETTYVIAACGGVRHTRRADNGENVDGKTRAILAVLAEHFASKTMVAYEIAQALANGVPVEITTTEVP